MLIHKNMKLADVIHHDHTLVPIINRFGIHLGFGNDNIDEICRKYNTNADFFVTILNSFHDAHYFPKEQLQLFPAIMLIDYLQKAHHYFMEEKIPEISLLISKMTTEFPLDKTTFVLVNNFFKDYSGELKKHIQHEEEKIYPYVVSLEKTIQGGEQADNLSGQTYGYTISDYEAEHENMEEKLFDLKNIFIKYIPEPKDDKLVFQILRELFGLEKELNEHARIEDLILVPKVKAMEEILKNRKK